MKFQFSSSALKMGSHVRQVFENEILCPLLVALGKNLSVGPPVTLIKE